VEPITWTVTEFEEKDRHPDWIWYAGLISVIVAVLSFFYGNIFFGIFALVAGATVIIHVLKEPQQLTITISAEGVLVNEELFPYKNVKQFWLDETGKQDKLLLLVRKSFMPLLSFNIEGVDGDMVRAALKHYAVPEVEMRESSSIKIFEQLGF
jgi:hypothetical protein